MSDKSKLEKPNQLEAEKTEPKESAESHSEKKEDKDVLEKEAERIALGKLEVLRQLWQKDYGKRFYHHSFCPPFTVNNYSLWEHDFPKDYTPADFMKDSAKAILEHGLLSKEELKNKGLEVLTRSRLKNFVGGKTVSVYTDMRGSFYEEYGGVTITFIIDQDKVNSLVESSEDNPFLEKNVEKFIPNQIPIDCIVGAYVANTGSPWDKKVNYKTQIFIETLIEGFKESPNKSFPIIWGPHHEYPIDASYKNYEDVADFLTSELYFPKTSIQREKLSDEEIEKRRKSKDWHNDWVAGRIGI